MKDNKRKSEESDNYITDYERSSLISNGQQPVQAKGEWDVFTNKPPVIVSGSMADQTCTEVSLQIVKVLAYICTFLFVLGGAVLSKGTLLFMTSQLGNQRRIDVCNEIAEVTGTVTLPEEERVGWIWCLFFAYAIPEVMTFLRSCRICFFKTVTKPTALQFFVVATAETLRTIGTGLLVFMILPNLDVVKGAMLTNCLCFVPGLLVIVSAFISQQEETEGRPGAAYYVRQGINGLALAAQLTGFILWPVLLSSEPETPRIWVLPIALLLISCGWWENFITATKIEDMTKFLLDLKACRYYTFLYVSLWKIACFFCIMLLVTYVQYDVEDCDDDSDTCDVVGNLFYLFDRSFSQRNITVNGSTQNREDTEFEATYLSALWVLLIHALGSYICYITGKFACRIRIQRIGFALPVTITMPIVVSLLIIFWHLRENNSCQFTGTIPDYLFFNFNFDDLIAKHAWVWLLWLLSQIWISLHIWTPKVDRLSSTEILFRMPMYESLFVDQSLALNRQQDKGRELSTEELDVEHAENFVPHYQCLEGMEPASEVRDVDHVRRVYACATMWHETPSEMRTMLNSIFRMDEDQASRRLAQKHFGIVDPDYYEFETHIFFDDAFELSKDKEKQFVVNEFVRNLMDTIDQAAKDVHRTDCHIEPPVKFPTPYGGRLEWTLPGKTKMIAHLKNKDMIRHKKRWSQVMYMYYLLGHRLMELPIHPTRKAVIARNTFILALDGDIDFKPDAVLLLLDLMRKDEKLGAACGRIHPMGEGPMVWYQKFEYAIGHWLQKATEHVIGCVLCSPGCFSLFRGEALMDDAVMNKYTTVSKEAKDYVQYDQGEDRWLCTLLLQRGYRVEYSAASDAYTHSPEGFDEFYNQRRRWIPSTMANILDLLNDYKRTVKINDNISFIYILYQAVLFGGSILGPGSIFLMLVGAFVVAFRIDIWISFLLNIVPILIYMYVCLVCKKETQLMAAKILSAIYGLVMMAVLVGIMLQIIGYGPLGPSSLFFFMVAGAMIIAGFLHPQEVRCLISGVVYYVTVPSMYFLLIIYAIFNLNDVSWGTREVATNNSEKELEQEKKTAEEAKKEAKNKSFWGKLRGDKKNKDEEEGYFEFSLAGLFRCMCCTHPKGGEEKLQLLRIADSLDKLNRRIDNIETAADPAPQSQQRRSTTIRHDKQDVNPLMETEENNLDEDTDSYNDDEDTESEEVWNEQGDPYWMDHHPALQKGPIHYLPPDEIQFWDELIDKYLHPLDKDAEKEKKDAKKLKDLRNKAVFTFFMMNALYVLVIFMLQVNNELHIRWPLGSGETNNPDANPVLDPIGLSFIVVFGVILIIQFIAMLVHRFGTLSHMLATTRLKWFKRGAQPEDKHADAKAAVDFTKKMQGLRGADGNVVDKRDLMQEQVGRRKTVLNIHETHHFGRNNRAPLCLDSAFERRISQTEQNNDMHPEIYRRLTVRNRETVNQMVTTARNSIMQERRTSQLRQESREGSMKNMRLGNMGTMTEA